MARGGGRDAALGREGEGRDVSGAPEPPLVDLWAGWGAAVEEE